jgi:hypothetical protein
VLSWKFLVIRSVRLGRQQSPKVLQAQLGFSPWMDSAFVSYFSKSGLENLRKMSRLSSTSVTRPALFGKGRLATRQFGSPGAPRWARHDWFFLRTAVATRAGGLSLRNWNKTSCKIRDGKTLRWRTWNLLRRPCWMWRRLQHGMAYPNCGYCRSFFPRGHM